MSKLALSFLASYFSSFLVFFIWTNGIGVLNRKMESFDNFLVQWVFQAFGLLMNSVYFFSRSLGDKSSEVTASYSASPLYIWLVTITFTVAIYLFFTDESAIKRLLTFQVLALVFVFFVLPLIRLVASPYFGEGVDKPPAAGDVSGAVASRNSNELKRLLEAGADPNDKDYRGKEALLVATVTDQFRKANLLMDYGADVWATDKFGFTPGNNTAFSNVTPESIEGQARARFIERLRAAGYPWAPPGPDEVMKLRSAGQWPPPEAKVAQTQTLNIDMVPRAKQYSIGEEIVFDIAIENTLSAPLWFNTRFLPIVDVKTEVYFGTKKLPALVRTRALPRKIEDFKLIAPGETGKAIFQLRPNYFDVSKPGKYKIRITYKKGLDKFPSLNPRTELSPNSKSSLVEFEIVRGSNKE